MHASSFRVPFPIEIVICVGLVANCGGSPPDYLGEQPPGETPRPFAPGIVNTDAIELNGVVSPDSREFFFTRVIDGVFVMHRRVLREDGAFDEPVNLGSPVNSEHSEGDT